MQLFDGRLEAFPCVGELELQLVGPSAPSPPFCRLPCGVLLLGSLFEDDHEEGLPSLGGGNGADDEAYLREAAVHLHVEAPAHDFVALRAGRAERGGHLVCESLPGHLGDAEDGLSLGRLEVSARIAVEVEDVPFESTMTEGGAKRSRRTFCARTAGLRGRAFLISGGSGPGPSSGLPGKAAGAGVPMEATVGFA